MGFATVYCERCGSQIAGIDFEKGRAVERSGKNYCPECVIDLPPLVSAESKKKSGITAPKRPGEHPRDTDIIRNLSGLGGRSNTTRIHHEPHANPAAGMPASAKIGMGVAGAVIVILIAVVLASSGGSSGGKGGGGGDDSAAQAKAAEAAIEKAESARAGKPKEFLELTTRARREAAGTSYASRAEVLHTEALALVEAEEKGSRIEEEARMVAREIAGAEDPVALDSVVAELVARARKVNEPLGQRVLEVLNGAKVRGLVKQVGAVDLDFAATPHGLRMVEDQLDGLAKAGAGLGASVSALTEAIAKKRVEAKEAFTKGAEKAFAELDRRVQALMKDMRYSEAETELNAFLASYKGMEVAAKAELLATDFRKKKKALEDAWVVPKSTEWKADLKDAKMTENGGVMEFVHEGTPSATEDLTRKITFQADDKTWKNMEVHFDVFIEKVGGMLMLNMAENNPVKVGFPVAGGGQGLPPGQWHHLELRLSGNQIVMGGVASGSFAATPTSGGIAFVVYPGGKFKLRNIKARRLP